MALTRMAYCHRRQTTDPYGSSKNWLCSRKLVEEMSNLSIPDEEKRCRACHIHFSALTSSLFSVLPSTSALRQAPMALSGLQTDCAAFSPQAGTSAGARHYAARSEALPRKQEDCPGFPLCRGPALKVPTSVLCGGCTRSPLGNAEAPEDLRLVWQGVPRRRRCDLPLGARGAGHGLRHPLAPFLREGSHARWTTGP